VVCDTKEAGMNGIGAIWVRAKANEHRLLELLSRLDITHLQRMFDSHHSLPTHANETLSVQIFPGYSYADPSRFAGGCELVGIPLSGNRHLGNIGSSSRVVLSNVD